MSTEQDKLNVNSSSSTRDVSMDSRVSQAETRDGHEKPQEHVYPGPNRVNSMLSRRATFCSATRNQKNKFTRRMQRLKRANFHQTSNTSSRQNDGEPMDRDAVPIRCDLDTIMELISSGGQCVRSSSDRSKTVKLPEFDDLRAYLPAGLSATELWKDEATRLKGIVESHDPSLVFNPKGFFSGDGEEGYQDLGRLAEIVFSAFSLCLMDNECINVESCKALANRDRLKKLLQQAQVSQTNGEWEENREGDQAKKKTSDAIFSLIDYISAILARLISQSATGNFWCGNVLAVLTKRVTKLKVLLLDMNANTLISCQAGEAALDRTGLSSKLSNGILDEEECEEVLRMIDTETKEGLTTTANAEVARYCVDQNRNRSGIDTIFRYLLLSLRFQNRSGLHGTSFEICGMVYATGFEDFKALLFQDRDLEYSASSDQDTINTAHSAFKILYQALKHVKQDAPRKPPGRLQTTVEWGHCEAEDKTPRSNLSAEYSMCDLSQYKMRTAVMDSMGDIVTVMVPLILTSPVAVSNLTKYRTMMALTSDAKDVVQPFKEKDYNAFFRMYTDKFEVDSKAWDVMRLSDAVKAKVFSRYNLASGGDTSKSSKKIARKMTEMSREMDGWVIDEKGITVNCKFQVCYIVLVAFLIAAGGLSVIAAGDRITAVDPSNLSTYLWVVAGFYLLVCKSRFVQDWPWSDFLHFRVRCRSVSELHAISGINEQFIIAKLLHDERGGGVLKTRGPYNKVFLQHGSDEGFSIDCPLHMTTLLLSGLIMLKVVTPRGHALVCLDARRGTELKVVEHQGSEAQEHLVCDDINRLQDQQRWKKPQDKMRLQLVKSKELKWKRVQGVYKDMDAIFV
ncbi:uncharacterized protein F4807DRAFT_220998 [Annulohypoxylon truncatum]|uniref:uncharacterized protein n=1 Tax=Annulohypoxylon truncatum TaxID=327061 RepID=UPI002007603F|nr:uncharacterized protein F4807DRAFT_220998 [Annulohypoxylon truncatum]KAI1206714.1 hypothetical protein F4807DRAFT_220998 [Annulohypoxylon truncatum]